MATPTGTLAGEPPKMRRTVGFYGLTFVSLGSIIGSGWLLGADKAAAKAGPASMLSWILAAAMLTVLALIHAELGTAYPVAGGTARFPAFAYGKLTGFVAGWSAWIQAVAIAPIEVEASLQYINNIDWVQRHLDLVNKVDDTLNPSGLGIATLLMALFTYINVVGVKFLSDSNSITVIWKTAIPVLTVVVLISLRFHPGNFSTGGGFAPNGAHGVFAALPAGVVFALQGFEQAIQLGGEAREPHKDISRAILTAMLIGAAVYILLEVAFIGSLNPADVAKNWDNPISKGALGPYATLATGAGAGWLAFLLYTDGFISPAGTGLVYTGTSSRLSYAMAHADEVPKVFAKISHRGVPVWSIVLAFVVGELAFLPFPSWQSLVGLVTSATAIMYAFGPVSLMTLRRIDGERFRPYRLKAASVLAPIGFCSANLIIYWGGYDTTYKIVLALVLGLIVFALNRAFGRGPKSDLDWKPAMWVWPWLAGTVVLGFLGRYDSGSAASELNLLPDGWDVLVIVAFSLVIYYFAVSLGVSSDRVEAAVAKEKADLAEVPGLSLDAA